MPTSTFDISPATNDGCGYKGDGTWANVPTASYNVLDDTPITVAKSLFGIYRVYNSYLRYDTSSLPDDATVTAASLKLYLNDKGDPDGISYAADYYDFGGEPSVDADWELTSSGNAISSWTGASQTIGVVNTISLTTLGSVSLSGFTGFRLAPLNNTAPAGDNFLDYAGAEDGTPARRPQLEVTYTQPAAGASVAWIRA